MEVLERQPANHETQPRSCRGAELLGELERGPISNIRERAEGDHQAIELD